MKLAGMLLLPAGWGIVLSAAVLFPRSGTRVVFILAGLAIQGIGLVLAFRGNMRLPGEAK